MGGAHLVITMDHDHDAQGSGGEAPGVLPAVLPLLINCLELDVEHLGEVLAEAVRGASLDPSACVWNEALHCRCVQAASEFLCLRLQPLQARRRKSGILPSDRMDRYVWNCTLA